MPDPLRIAVGGISHETSTFAPTPTTLGDFETGFGLFRGREIVDRFTGANVCTGGFLAGAEKHGFEAVPLLWTFAYPGGLIERAAYEALETEFLDRLRKELPVDGVLLDLHGAMVIEGIPDGDGHFIASVRNVVGPDVPIVVTQDLHGNHTRERIETADAVIGFDTYPHVDMAERGEEAAELIVRTIQGEIRPVGAIAPLPLLWSTATQVTAHPPMDEVVRRVHELEQREGVLTVSVATGFAWADVPHVGASVFAVADGDRELAQATADELAAWIWENRETWYTPPVAVRDALAEGERLGKSPIVLADHADNTGGGTPGDSTEILRTFLEMGLQDAAILYVVDPDVAEAAHAAGVGSRLQTAVGGKSDPRQGAPVEMNAEVMAVSDGDFTYDGPMYAGLTGNMGRSAWLQQDGVSVVVVTAREQPLGPAFARTLGLDPASMKYVAVKSAAHFRASFEPISGSIFNVDAEAIQTHDFARLEYENRTREVFPVEIRPRGGS